MRASIDPHGPVIMPKDDVGPSFPNKRIDALRCQPANSSVHLHREVPMLLPIPMKRQLKIRERLDVTELTTMAIRGHPQACAHADHFKTIGFCRRYHVRNQQASATAGEEFRAALQRRRTMARLRHVCKVGWIVSAARISPPPRSACALAAFRRSGGCKCGRSRS